MAETKTDIDAEDHPVDSPETQAFISRVRARPEAKIMSLVDNDHDGNATEFFLPTGPAPMASGLPYGIIVGVSTTNPHLHAFGTARHPDTPLVLNGIQWFELLHRGDLNEPVRVQDRQCSDPGATTDTELELEATPKGISVISREYAGCGKEARRLVHEEYK
ncbi:MAG TPA: hypothetical protein VGK48_11625 [Terriglobia bacterium]|jgi:hypothetical protein